MLEIAPIYYSFGNHEWGLNEQDIRVIRKTGAVLLNDEFIEIDKSVYLGGLRSTTRNGRYKGTSQIPNQNFIHRFSALNGMKILLCHHPEYYDEFLKN